MVALPNHSRLQCYIAPNQPILLPCGNHILTHFLQFGHQAILVILCLFQIFSPNYYSCPSEPIGPLVHPFPFVGILVTL